MTVRPFDEVFRDFVIPHVPASGVFHPEKKDIRDSLNAVIAGPFPDNRVIKLNNANEGTPNEIIVSASVAIPAAAYQVLYILNVTQENTGPVTVSGAINRALVTNINQPVPAGYLTPGMAVLCIDTGTELRMLSYGDVEAEVEALVDRAEDAAAAAEAAAGGLLSNFDTVPSVEAANIPSLVHYVRTAGYSAVGDGGAALYKRVASEPSHAGKVRSDDGAWWEIAISRLSPRMFGAKADWNRSTLTGTDNGNALRAMFETSKALGGLPMVIDGRFAFSGNLPITNTPVSIRGEWFSGAMLVCTDDSDGIVINQNDYWNSTYVEGVSILTQILSTKTALLITYSAADSIGNRNFPRCVVRGVNMYGVDLLQHGWGGGLLATNVHNATYDEITVNGRRDQSLPQTDIEHWATMEFGIKIVGSDGFTAVPSDILINNPRIYGAVAGIDLVGECEGVRIDNYILVGVQYGITGSMSSTRPWVQILGGHINYLTRGIKLTNSPQSNIDGALLYKFQFSTDDSYAIEFDGCDHSQTDNIRLYNLCSDASVSGVHNGIAINNSNACSVGDIIAHNPTRVVQITGTSTQCRIKTPLMQGVYPNSPTRDAVFDSSTGGGNEYGGSILQASNGVVVNVPSSLTNILTTDPIRLGKGERVQIDIAVKGTKPGSAGFMYTALAPSSGDGGVGYFGLIMNSLENRQFGVSGDWSVAYSGTYSVVSSGTFTFNIQGFSEISDASVPANGAQITVTRL
ncbi:hypothetical protein Brsp07_01885 [Brucella sp. NBRC 14130]|uniref:hypothetical protein n=1 Tax=Brucella sp. NBRC 14130 TaxID=3075483 RepID=UPI00309D463C